MNVYKDKIFSVDQQEGKTSITGQSGEVWLYDQEADRFRDAIEFFSSTHIGNVGNFVELVYYAKIGSGKTIRVN